jgi:hypothetical protein
MLQTGVTTKAATIVIAISAFKQIRDGSLKMWDYIRNS